MKKTLVTMLAAVAVAASSFGQGTINFTSLANQVTKDTAPGNSVQVNVATGLANGSFQLLWAPVGTADVNLFNPVPGAIIATSPTAGRLSGGARTVPAGTGFSGVAPGAVALFVVRGWTGGFASYAAAEVSGSAAIGYTPIFQVDLGDPGASPAQTPTAMTVAGGFTGIQLHYVPEPSSMALAGLGAASLLIFRRRK